MFFERPNRTASKKNPKTITTTTTKMNAFISFIPSRKFIQNVRYIKNTIVLTEISSKGAEKGFLVKIKKNSCCKL